MTFQDQRLREATSMEMTTELRRLFQVLPPRGSGMKTDDEAALARVMQGQIEGYIIAIQGVTAHALKHTINRIIRGEIDGISRKYCPLAPELAHAIREEMSSVTKQVQLAQNRNMIEDNRPQAVKNPNVLEKVKAERDRMKTEGRALLMKFESFDAFSQYARRNILPANHFYLTPTAELFGAPGSIHDLPKDHLAVEVPLIQENATEKRDTSLDAARARLEALGGDGCLNDLPNAGENVIFNRKPVTTPKPKDDEKIPW